MRLCQCQEYAYHILLQGVLCPGLETLVICSFLLAALLKSCEFLKIGCKITLIFSIHQTNNKLFFAVILFTTSSKIFSLWWHLLSVLRHFIRFFTILLGDQEIWCFAEYLVCNGMNVLVCSCLRSIFLEAFLQIRILHYYVMFCCEHHVNYSAEMFAVFFSCHSQSIILPCINSITDGHLPICLYGCNNMFVVRNTIKFMKINY